MLRFRKPSDLNNVLMFLCVISGWEVGATTAWAGNCGWYFEMVEEVLKILQRLKRANAMRNMERKISFILVRDRGRVGERESSLISTSAFSFIVGDVEFA